MTGHVPQRKNTCLECVCPELKRKKKYTSIYWRPKSKTPEQDVTIHGSVLENSSQDYIEKSLCTKITCNSSLEDNFSLVFKREQRTH